MGEIKPAEYYDDFYKVDKSYSVHYSKSNYYNLWVEVIKKINDDELIQGERIIDLGCGVGQFAHMLYDHGYRRYAGFDFSQVAIDKCNSLGLGADFIFKKADLNTISADYDFYLCLETLEHIDDIKLLSNLKKGAHIIFTVPSFDAPGHARHFKSKKEVDYYYQNVINILSIETFESFFIGVGYIK